MTDCSTATGSTTAGSTTAGSTTTGGNNLKNLPKKNEDARPNPHKAQRLRSGKAVSGYSKEDEVAKRQPSDLREKPR